MTPDITKIKCKNLVEAVLRLACDQPEAVARNIRSLILICKMKACSKAHLRSRTYKST